MAYLDNSATTAVYPASAALAVRMMTECFGNPSSLHTLGFEAEQQMTAARKQIAALISAEPDAVIFTSGGTEANNLALLGAAEAKKRDGKHVLTSQTEHPSVSAACDRLEALGFEVERLAPRPDGNIDPEAVYAACRPDTVLVSLMTVNNETGARFPWETVHAEIRRRAPRAILHTDAVQAAGKLALSVQKMGVDLLSMSGHKLHAPKGVGALYVRKGVRLTPPAALGGGQEKGRRSGTENVPGIVAFGDAASRLPAPAEADQLYRSLRDTLLDGLRAFSGIVPHLPENGVPYIVNFSMPGFKSETLLHFLAQRQVYVSGGSACAKGHKSPVLTAMGLPANEIDSALRVSFSDQNTKDDVQALLDALRDARDTLIHT